MTPLQEYEKNVQEEGVQVVDDKKLQVVKQTYYPL